MLSLRICEEKTCLETFETAREGNRRYHSRECMLKARRRRRSEKVRAPEPPIQRRRQAYKRRGYGITPEEFDELVLAQGSRCAICRKVADLVPDHCHAGGGFRGAICTPCNHMLGKAYDDPETLERAAEYLRNVRSRSS